MADEEPLPPHYLICPISQTLIEDPVILYGDGYTYERSCIEQWLSIRGVSPVTHRRLSSVELDLIPNYALKSAIEDWVEKNKQSAQSHKRKKVHTTPFPEFLLNRYPLHADLKRGSSILVDMDVPIRLTRDETTYIPLQCYLNSEEYFANIRKWKDYQVQNKGQYFMRDDGIPTIIGSSVDDKSKSRHEFVLKEIREGCHFVYSATSLLLILPSSGHVLHREQITEFYLSLR